MLNVSSGNVTSAQGFLAAGVDAGVKKPGVLDMALILSELPATGAGVYTTNKVQAAPLTVTREHLAGGKARAVVVNAGNANACTGEQGLTDARMMAAQTAGQLGLEPQEVLVASTGVIGVNMPMERVKAGILCLAANLSREGGEAASRAIMTTDLVAKTGKVTFTLGGKEVTIGGMAKGSGMIHPNMATMLAFFTTDAEVEAELLQKAMYQAAQNSFNMISVDGDTSTNDMALILANGAAGAPAIEHEDDNFCLFVRALTQLARHLAKAIARDGEGATRLIEVQVEGALAKEDARKIAMAIIKSSLVKTAVFGADANWGRILCAAGYSGADFDPEKTDIYLGQVQTAAAGRGIPFDEEAATRELQKDTVVIKVDLNQGSESATAWGCDLTYDYVKINGSYRT